MILSKLMVVSFLSTRYLLNPHPQQKNTNHVGHKAAKCDVRAGVLLTLFLRPQSSHLPAYIGLSSHFHYKKALPL